MTSPESAPFPYNIVLLRIRREPAVDEAGELSVWREKFMDLAIEHLVAFGRFVFMNQVVPPIRHSQAAQLD